VLWYPPRLDETGADVVAVDTNVLTATAASGTVAASGTCSDWTSTAGNTLLGRASGGTTIWTEYTQTSCNSPMRLYCFGVSETNAVHAAPVAGRIAFVVALWPPSGGLAGADASCTADATAAGLPGSFRALLATTTATAVSRFSDGTPWVRPDGIPVAANLAQLRSR